MDASTSPLHTPEPPPRSPLRRVLVACGLLVYSLTFGEIFVRFVDPQPLMPRYVTAAPWGVRGNIPGARYWHETGEVRVEYRINSEGMRDDREFTVEKAAGTCRIALFGDSFFMGYELDLRDTFASKLEERLRTTGAQVEVLNFSVSGFGTAEMLRTYEKYGRNFDPDIVVFEWHGTDVDDNFRSGLYHLVKGAIEPGATTYLPATDLQDRLTRLAFYRYVSEHSHLYSAVREKAGRAVKRMLVDLRQRLASRTERSAPDADGDDEEVEAAPDARRVALSAALLSYTSHAIQAEHRAFYIVDVPRRLTRTSFLSTIEVLPAQDRAQLPIVSPAGAFARVANPDLKLYYEMGAGHFTPTAIGILVDVVAPLVSHAPQLQSCGAPAAQQASLPP